MDQPYFTLLLLSTISNVYPWPCESPMLRPVKPTESFRVSGITIDGQHWNVPVYLLEMSCGRKDVQNFVLEPCLPFMARVIYFQQERF
jgi:hypothetical protein